MGTKVLSFGIVTSIKYSGTLRTLSREASTQDCITWVVSSPGIVCQLHEVQKAMPLACSQNESVWERGDFEERDGKKKSPSVQSCSGPEPSAAEGQLGIVSGGRALSPRPLSE